MPKSDPGATEGNYSFPNHVRNPFRVMLAMWRVMKDIKNTAEAGIVEIAFARSRRLRGYARWDSVIARMSENELQIQSAFAKRERLGWIDVEALSQLPAGTLGRVLADHLTGNGLNPNLVDIPVEDDGSYLLAHLYETHDIWHVVSGCGTDEAGEFAVGGFYAAQTEAPFFAFLLGLVFFNTAFSKPEQFRERMEGLARGFLAGRRARPFFGVDWTKLWEVPIETVRRDLCVDANPAYAGDGIQKAA